MCLSSASISCQRLGSGMKIENCSWYHQIDGIQKYPFRFALQTNTTFVWLRWRIQCVEARTAKKAFLNLIRISSANKMDKSMRLNRNDMSARCSTTALSLTFSIFYSSQPIKSGTETETAKPKSTILLLLEWHRQIACFAIFQQIKCNYTVNGTAWHTVAVPHHIHPIRKCRDKRNKPIELWNANMMPWPCSLVCIFIFKYSTCATDSGSHVWVRVWLWLYTFPLRAHRTSNARKSHMQKFSIIIRWDAILCAVVSFSFSANFCRMHVLR